jgi:hypothetical protein
LALDYVFDQEIQAYHAWRNKDLGFNQASHQLLQDKARFAECVAAQGISVVPNLARVPKFEPDLAPLRESLHCAGHVFCKMNSGNQGRGAFAAWQVTQGWAGRSYSGAALSDTGAVENAWRQLLLLDDALIQPCLANHPELAPLAGLDELITVRFISQWQDDGAGLACLSAILEVPAGLSKKGQIFYANLPILAETGELRPATQASLTPDGAVRAALERVAYLAGLQPALPGWGELVSASYRAHALFTDVRAIAWDWAITPDGPVLLEGNSGWGLGNLQVLSAIGLLAEEGCAN